MTTLEERENAFNDSIYHQEPIYASVRKTSRLEDFYGGREVAQWAAIVIQRAYRAHRLRIKFDKLLSMKPTQILNTTIEDNLDRLILEAAGLSSSNVIVPRPSARRIRPQQRNVRRSLSLKDARRGQTISTEVSRSKDDSELLPPPPPPPLHVVPHRSRKISHGRSYSSPVSEVITNPVPPPYLGPPLGARNCDSPLPPPPPPPPGPSEIYIDAPLPPPPPALTSEAIRVLPPRGEIFCGSTSSSVSSIDSGYPTYDTASRLPLRYPPSASPIRRSPSTSETWIPSPNVIVSPESARQFRETVLEEDNNFHYEDVYSHVLRNRLPPPPNSPLKKTVRIQTPTDDVTRKRQYRVGLNLFNQNPERGMDYLLKKNYVDYSPSAVAKFLFGRKGVSKRMIGEYLTSLQRPFNMAVLHCFVHEIDFSGLHIDIALRMLQQEVTLPGEAQKIEKMIEVFAKRYIQCNQMFVSGFKSPDTIFVLSYAMVLLNTDLHSRAARSSKMRQMRREDFIRNLRGVDSGNDLDEDMLRGIYDRIRTNEFRPGPDHHTQVSRVEENIKGNYDKCIGGRLAEPHRRLVCFCRLTEVMDVNKRDKKPHQRGVFLFNDLLVVTKSLLTSKKKSSVHQYRYSIPLRDLKVNMFSTKLYPYGIHIQDRFSGKLLATFDAKSDTDQQRFVNDLQESISETIEMDRARLFMDQEEML